MIVNQVDNKLQYHTDRLTKYPDDLDSLLYVGDSYLLQGMVDEALMYYQRALNQRPLRKDIERRIHMAQRPISPYAVPPKAGSDEEDIKITLQRLSARLVPVTDEEAYEVRAFLDTILASREPEKLVELRLSKVESLLPAQIELDLRRARRDKKLDQIQSLSWLLGVVTQKIEDLKNSVDDVERTRGHRNPLLPVRVMEAGCVSIEAPFRQGLFLDALTRLGFQVSKHDGSTVDWKAPDVLVAHNPHGDTSIMKGLALRDSLRLPTVVDFALDFRKMSPEHPEFQFLGPGNLENMRSLNASLQMANRITVASAATATGLKDAGYRVEWIPEGWSQANTLWEKVLPERPTVNLGLFVIPGQVEDVNQARRAVIRVMREFPNTRLLIHGDPVVYNMFDSISEVRRQYLPSVEPEDFPYLLAQVDILLIPLGETPYNQHKNDHQLMEAGIRGIPYVASPAWAAVEWAEGGQLAYSVDEWYSQLRSLLLDSRFRQILGQAGQKKALQREMKVLGNLWSTVIQQALSSKGSK